MKVHTDLIKSALMHARQVRDFHKQLALGDGPEAKDPDSVLRICREYINKKVEIIAVDLGKPIGSVRAWYEVVGEGYEIYVIEQQEADWRAFACCKEMFHVVLDDPNSEVCRTVDLNRHVAESASTLVYLNGSPGPTVQNEFMAELAAMEFHLPYAERVKLLSHTSAPNYAEIAKRYGLPVALVERYLFPGMVTSLAPFAESLMW